MRALTWPQNLRQSDTIFPTHVLAMPSIWAVMLYIDDKAGQENCLKVSFASLAKDMVLSGGLDFMPNNGAIRLLRHVEPRLDLSAGVRIEAARKAKAAEQRRLHPGDIAGLTILIPLVANLRHGLDIGRFAAMDFIKGEPGLPSKLKDKRRNYQAIWDRYKSAAHLWAARRIVPHITDEHDFQLFMRVAWVASSWGSSFKPKRADAPMLDARSAWQVPGEYADPAMLQNFSAALLSEAWLTELRRRDQ